ncbi:MAG TPA: SAM-dependent methyltransferase, partial [Bacteroidia bacterium]|nr:SAM-dependent methyltransferase [Bacteroidia bacterium]
NAVIKDISFVDKGRKFLFTEKVQLLRLDDFKKLLEPFFTIENIFGDYKLGKFDEGNSPRLILIARKK